MVCVENGPDKAGEFPGHGGDGDVTVLFLIESPELFVEPVLGLKRDGDDVGRLTLATSVQDEIGARAVAIVPGGFHQKSSGVGVAGFGDGTPAISLSGRTLGGNEAEVGHERSRGAEASHVVDLGEQRHGGEGLDAAQTAESLDATAIGR